MPGPPMIEAALLRARAIRLITAADAAATPVDPSWLPNTLANRIQSRRAEERMQMPAAR